MITFFGFMLRFVDILNFDIVSYNCVTNDEMFYGNINHDIKPGQPWLYFSRIVLKYQI